MAGERSTIVLPTTVQRTVPSALTDRQFQDIIDSEVLKERERIVGVLRSELAAVDSRGGLGTGWSWEKWRKKMLDAIDNVPAPR